MDDESGPVEENDGAMLVNGEKIRLLSERDSKNLPWGELETDVVIESTRRFTDKAAAQAHIDTGAKKVLITTRLQAA